MEHRPIFVAFNAPFDWMFINIYFHRYLGHNPFGYSALDIKAYYMGLCQISWSDTSFRKIAAVYGEKDHLNHNALEDAVDQARLFQWMLLEMKTKKREPFMSIEIFFTNARSGFASDHGIQPTALASSWMRTVPCNG